MHTHTCDLSAWQHPHRFDTGSATAERGTRQVLWITLVVMVIEIAAGWRFNSMALLADGWHMSSHALAIGLSAFAYAAARRYADDPRFTFGTWKIEVLAGFASALLLIGIAATMVFESAERLWTPGPIHYREAVAVAAFGLAVNLLSAWLLGGARGHDHDHAPAHEHGHDHGHGHDDMNLRSAYLHVLADAATSVLAIAALLGGWFWGWGWLDPLVGLLGALVVANWARGLLRETGCVLLDREMDHPVAREIREGIEHGLTDSATRVADLHIWRVGRAAYACAVTVVTHSPTLCADEVRACFSMHEEIRHSTVEIQHCPGG